MGRFFISVLFVAMATNFAAAQQKGFFRYAADPFEETESAPADVRDEATPSPGQPSSFSSYETQDEISPVHRRAMYKAQQRQLLLASRQWYGHSALRPMVRADPYSTSYRPIYPVMPITVMQVQRPYRTYNGYYDWY